MRYQSLPSDLFTTNRERLAALLAPKGAAILHGHDQILTNGDGTLPYVPHSDIYYLTGITQEDTALLLFPDAYDRSQREVLFIRRADETLEKWEGHKLTKAEARDLSGVAEVRYLDELDAVLQNTMPYVQQVYLYTNEHLRAHIESETRNDRFITEMRKRYPLHQYARLSPLLFALRSVKQPAEIEALQRAIDITEKGFKRVAAWLKPGAMEYEMEAEFVHEFIRHGSRGFAYAPIIASGDSACVLHYISNHQPMKDGDCVLIDVGAEYARYNADMTRVLPVNGRFTDRQKQVYNAVLNVTKAATQLLVPGNNIVDYTQEVSLMVESACIDLGLFTRDEVKKQQGEPLFRQYFYHGVSHLLGLDVHDVGHRYETFKPGMVFTVEPGIYIAQEGIGVRLENNILVTDNGPVNLMANIPIEVEEVEGLMR